jgi:hypothetical protein
MSRQTMCSREIHAERDRKLEEARSSANCDGGGRLTQMRAG